MDIRKFFGTPKPTSSSTSSSSNSTKKKEKPKKDESKKPNKKRARKSVLQDSDEDSDKETKKNLKVKKLKTDNRIDSMKKTTPKDFFSNIKPKVEKKETKTIAAVKEKKRLDKNDDNVIIINEDSSMTPETSKGAVKKSPKKEETVKKKKVENPLFPMSDSSSDEEVVKKSKTSSRKPEKKEKISSKNLYPMSESDEEGVAKTSKASEKKSVKKEEKKKVENPLFPMSDSSSDDEVVKRSKKISPKKTVKKEEMATTKKKVENLYPMSDSGDEVVTKKSTTHGKRNNNRSNGGASLSEKLSKVAAINNEKPKQKVEKKTKTEMNKTPEKKKKEIKAETPTSSNGRKTATPTSSRKKTPTSEAKKSASKNIVPATPEAEEEAAQAKRDRFIKFKQYRDKLACGPSNPGCKEVPIGADNCLEGLAFVITGMQESLNRDEIKSLIERYAGRVTTAVSGKTAYLITGDEAGESKTKKAEKLGTKVITEDEFLELIRTLPEKVSKYDVTSDKTPTKPKSKSNKSSTTPKANGKKQQQPKQESTSSNGNKQIKQKVDEDGLAPPVAFKAVKIEKNNTESDNYLMWVDKYKPKQISQIIGQQGAQSNMNKLKRWLEKWHYNHTDPEGKKRTKPKPGPWGGGDTTGAYFKAALLSGPPGVGKTTTATLVCQQLGLKYIELNASDRRSKRSLNEEVAEYLHSSSLTSAFNQFKGGSAIIGKTTSNKHVLLMDEVDGMAGNEDRGGMQELIQLMKTSKIPIICMCNDRSSQKMRSLVNYTFDLRFQRPRVEQITGAVMSICFKEGLKIPAPAVQALIRGCNQDVRQVLHNLSLIRKKNESFSYDDVKEHNEMSNKDVNLGLFEIARQLLSAEASQKSIMEKLNLFFMDYSMIPKFIQENYLNITPFATKGDMQKILEIKSKTADLMAESDIIEGTLRSGQHWSLLPTIGLISTVLPCTYNAGGMRGMIQFPQLLGKISSTGKSRRLLNELKFHSSMATCGATELSLNLDYLSYMKYHIMEPLLKQSQTGETHVDRSTQFLNDYDLVKEDFDNLMELTNYQGKTNPFGKVDSKVKAAFTRLYNKEAHSLPYSQAITGAKKRKKATVDLDGVEGNDDAVVESEEEEKVDLSKFKKKTTAKKKKSSAASSGGNATKKRRKK